MDVVKPWMETVTSGRHVAICFSTKRCIGLYELFESKLALRQRRYVLIQRILTFQPRFKSPGLLRMERIERVTNKSRHSNVIINKSKDVIKAAFVGMNSATLQRACERFRLRIETII